MKKILRLCLSLGFFIPQAPLSVFSETAEMLVIENLAIPKSLGKIEERFQGTSSRWVIQIQDVHAHLTAQENIAAIIDHLNALYGIDTLGLEGGWDQTRFAESWGLPSSREKQMLARGLLEEGHLNGPGYAALFSQTPLNLVGLENETLYKENLDQYREHLKSREDTLAKIAALQKKIIQEKASLYNSKLKKFDDSVMAFHNGEKPETFFPRLIEEAAAASVDFSDLPQMLIFKEALDKEKSLDKEKLEAEAKRLMESYKRKRLSFEELLKSGFIPEEQLSRYPASSDYLALLKLQDTLVFRVFFEELEVTIKRVKEKLFSSESERGLDFRWGSFLVMRDILSLEAAPHTLKIFHQHAAAIRALAEEAGLPQELSLALDFYDLVQKRDLVFFDRLNQNPDLSSRNVAVVTGGFHTEGLSEELRKAGISYLIITPDLGKDTEIQKDLYFKRLQDPVVETQTLSEIQNRFFTASFDQAFGEAVLFLQRERNIPAAIRIITDSFFDNAASKPHGVSPEETLSWSDFKSWPREKQLAWVEAALNEPEQKNIRFYLFAEHSVLEDLLREPAAKRIWEEVREERNNTVVIVLENPGDISSDLIGGKFKVERQMGTSLSAVVETPRFKSRFQTMLDQNLFAVILPEGIENPDTRMLSLKKHPASLFYRLFLSRPELRELASHQDFLNTLQGLLEEIAGRDQTLRAA